MRAHFPRMWRCPITALRTGSPALLDPRSAPHICNLTSGAHERDAKPRHAGRHLRAYAQDVYPGPRCPGNTRNTGRETRGPVGGPLRKALGTTAIKPHRKRSRFEEDSLIHRIRASDVTRRKPNLVEWRFSHYFVCNAYANDRISQFVAARSSHAGFNLTHENTATPLAISNCLFQEIVEEEPYASSLPSFFDNPPGGGTP